MDMYKLLPPLVFLIATLLMLLLHRFWPAVQIISTPFRWFGLLLLLAGIGISAWHKRLFHRIGTNIYTFDEPGKLVTEGMFRISRNPMYLGFVLALFGTSIVLGSLTPLIIVLSFIVLTDRWYIAFEEKAMLRKFGDQYLDYQKRVRRWI
jgi:protein-S-isoprenylcysteine O-methyltransferase Ste14